MINVNQLFKAGRTKKIFEVTDRLQVNDFFQTTGYAKSKLEGKMSRLKITIIDISKGKKEKSVVISFNLTTSEWNQNMKYLTNINAFQNRFNKGLTLTKANPYKKIGDFIEVNSLKISYESGLKTPKWKFAISKGKAIQKESFGYDSKTYSELSKVEFLLDILEVNEMVEYVTEYVALWKQSVFKQFLENRKAFSKRASMNNYDENSIAVWNINHNSKANSNNTNKAQKNSSNITQSNNYDDGANQKSNNNLGVDPQRKQLSCECCGQIVNNETAKITKNNFGKILCSECLKATLSKK